MAEQCYNWDTNRLYFNTKDDLQFDLRLKGKKTILYGDSGTGKTLLVTMINRFKADTGWLRPYDTDNIIILTKSNIQDMMDCTRKLIIIDKAERVLTDELVDKINSDRGINRYLIMVRKSLGIAVSPNYYAKLKLAGPKSIVLEYSYNVPGWN